MLCGRFMWLCPSMSMGDRLTILVAVGAIGATLGVGPWSNNARIDDVQEEIREVRALVIDAFKHGDRAD